MAKNTESQNIKGIIYHATHGAAAAAVGVVGAAGLLGGAVMAVGFPSLSLGAIGIALVATGVVFGGVGANLLVHKYRDTVEKSSEKGLAKAGAFLGAALSVFGGTYAGKVLHDNLTPINDAPIAQKQAQTQIQTPSQPDIAQPSQTQEENKKVLGVEFNLASDQSPQITVTILYQDYKFDSFKPK